MHSTTSDIKQVASDRFAPRHWRSDEGIVARPRAHAGGGIYSTASDMAQWLKLQLAEGDFEGRRILKPETVREMHALQFSVPIRARPEGNIYAAQFHGCGLGWFVQDYRGRKIVLHGGAWGAMVAMMPEERLGVVVLSNLDLESIASLLMYDVFDAYLVGPELAWDQKKWAATWLKNEPPGYAYRPRDEARAQLERVRGEDAKPSLPRAQYAGSYESPLYGRLIVEHDKGKLFVKFGEYTTELRQWQNDAFYVRTPTRLTFDWLLTFGISSKGKVNAVTVKHVGWDKDERDHEFSRIAN
jgi:hypothetical protein